MSNKNTVVKIGDNFKNRSIGHETMVRIVEDLKSIKQMRCDRDWETTVFLLDIVCPTY